MRKGYASFRQQASLRIISEVLTFITKYTGQRATNSDAIFYAAAFQAGIDEFILSNPAILTTPSTFIASRITNFSNDRSLSNLTTIVNAFSIYLPDDWRTSDKFNPVFNMVIFINDMMDAMSAGAAFLSIDRLPNPMEIKELIPDELFFPISHLFSTFTAVQTPSPIPQRVVSTDEVHRLNDILSGDLFSNYVNSQALLDASETPIEKTLPVIVSDARMLFLQNRKQLALRNATVNILQMTPKLIDAIFGKLPGALAEVATKLGISFLEARRRLVIYDFGELMYDEILRQNLLRLHEVLEPEQA
jgi:hypothetical protein